VGKSTVGKPIREIRSGGICPKKFARERTVGCALPSSRVSKMGLREWHEKEYQDSL
jgi:hypothetical protein